MPMFWSLQQLTSPAKQHKYNWTLKMFHFCFCDKGTWLSLMKQLKMIYLPWGTTATITVRKLISINLIHLCFNQWFSFCNISFTTTPWSHMLPWLKPFTLISPQALCSFIYVQLKATGTSEPCCLRGSQTEHQWASYQWVFKRKLTGW